MCESKGTGREKRQYGNCNKMLLTGTCVMKVCEFSVLFLERESFKLAITVK